MITLKDFLKNKEKLSRNVDVNIDSVIIQYGNEVEKLFFNKEALHEMRSTSKVLVAMAVGIAIEKQMKINDSPLTLQTKIYPIIKNVVNITNTSNLRKIESWTIKDLLTHSTGYAEQMMSERLIENIDKNIILDYALNYNIPYEAGTRYAYNNVEPFLLSVIFQEAFSINLADFIKEHIFKKIGVEEYTWGNYGKYCIGATGLYLKHSDFHKIGQLLLFEGKYGKSLQVIPSLWIKEMCKNQIATPSEFKPERVLPKIGAGYFTFISRDGYVFRDGSNGQYIIINKEKDLLITIMSSEPDMKKVGEILRGLI